MEIGHRRESVDTTQTTDTLSGLQVCALAAGGSHSCEVTATSELFTWGYGSSGQLGHGDFENQLVPKQVAALHDACVIAVATSSITDLGHTVAVTRNGSVFGWGEVERLGTPAGTAAALCCTQTQSLVEKSATLCIRAITHSFHANAVSPDSPDAWTIYERRRDETR